MCTCRMACFWSNVKTHLPKASLQQSYSMSYQSKFHPSACVWYLHAIDSTWYFTQTKTLNRTHSVLCNVTYDLTNKSICFLGIPVDVSPRNVHYMWFCSKTCLVGLLIRSIFRGKNCTSALVFGAGIHRWIYKLGTCNTASWWRPCC